MHVPPRPEFVSWSAARFQTEEARNQFLCAVETQESSEVDVAPMPDESRAALVRWRPGHFLDLNDIAYSHGGRIIVTLTGSHTGYDRSLSSVPSRRSYRSMNNA